MNRNGWLFTAKVVAINEDSVTFQDKDTETRFEIHSSVRSDTREFCIGDLVDFDLTITNDDDDLEDLDVDDYEN